MNPLAASISKSPLGIETQSEPKTGAMEMKGQTRRPVCPFISTRGGGNLWNFVRANRRLVDCALKHPLNNKNRGRE